MIYPFEHLAAHVNNKDESGIGTIPAVQNVPVIEIRTIDPAIKNKNEEILSQLLMDKQEIEVAWLNVYESGFDFKAYDYLEKLPHCELKIAIYGNYCITWTKKDKILLTYHCNLLWI